MLLLHGEINSRASGVVAVSFSISETLMELFYFTPQRLPPPPTWPMRASLYRRRSLRGRGVSRSIEAVNLGAKSEWKTGNGSAVLSVMNKIKWPSSLMELQRRITGNECDGDRVAPSLITERCELKMSAGWKRNGFSKTHPDQEALWRWRTTELKLCTIPPSTSCKWTAVEVHPLFFSPQVKSPGVVLDSKTSKVISDSLT